MDKIAVISDIHGNLPALEAVLEDIKERGADRIFCLGDIIGKGPSSREAIDICKTKCEIVVKGNWDDFINNRAEADNIHWNWYRNQIGEDRLNYLNLLPNKIEFYMSGKLFRLFHAHPCSLYKRVFPDSSVEERSEMFSFDEGDPEVKYKQVADIIGYGDIHNSYIQNLCNKVLFNTGSVGNSCDMPSASYAIIEGEYGSKIECSYSIQIIRLPYDKELAIAQAREAESLPRLEAYINEVRTAKYSR